jgi:hypothetical protein
MKKIDNPYKVVYTSKKTGRQVTLRFRDKRESDKFLSDDKAFRNRFKAKQGVYNPIKKRTTRRSGLSAFGIRFNTRF